MLVRITRAILRLGRSRRHRRHCMVDCYSKQNFSTNFFLDLVVLKLVVQEVYHLNDFLGVFQSRKEAFWQCRMISSLGANLEQIKDPSPNVTASSDYTSQMYTVN